MKKYKLIAIFFHLRFLPVSIWLFLRATKEFSACETRTLLLAIRLHGLQLRKYTYQPYWYHTLHVARLVKQHGLPTEAVCAALLHDVLEDTHVHNTKLWLLIYNCSVPDVDAVYKLIVQLTDQYTFQQYPHMNRASRKFHELLRLKEASLTARNIKLADVISNSTDIKKYDPKFYKIYQQECIDLVKSLRHDTLLALRYKAAVSLL